MLTDEERTAIGQMAPTYVRSVLTYLVEPCPARSSLPSVVPHGPATTCFRLRPLPHDQL